VWDTWSAHLKAGEGFKVQLENLISSRKEGEVSVGPRIFARRKTISKPLKETCSCDYLGEKKPKSLCNILGLNFLNLKAPRIEGWERKKDLRQGEKG